MSLHRDSVEPITKSEQTGRVWACKHKDGPQEGCSRKTPCRSCLLRKNTRAGRSRMAEADRLFSLIVRSRGKCEIGVVGKCPSGGLQCAHIVSRRYRAVRWDESNALCACAGCHHWMTVRPLEWERWCDENLGAETHAWLKQRALTERNPKVAEVTALLQKRWDAIEARMGEAG